MNKEIESYKTRLKYDEVFFNALYDSSQELYKIRTSIYCNDNIQNWDWEDVCSHIASNFKDVEDKLIQFLEKYYTALPPVIFEELEKARFLCAEGKSEFRVESENDSALGKASELWDILNKMSLLLKNIIDDKRLVEFSAKLIKPQQAIPLRLLPLKFKL